MCLLLLPLLGLGWCAAIRHTPCARPSHSVPLHFLWILVSCVFPSFACSSAEPFACACACCALALALSDWHGARGGRHSSSLQGGLLQHPCCVHWMKQCRCRLLCSVSHTPVTARGGCRTAATCSLLSSSMLMPCDDNNSTLACWHDVGAVSTIFLVLLMLCLQACGWLQAGVRPLAAAGLFSLQVRPL